MADHLNGGLVAAPVSVCPGQVGVSVSSLGGLLTPNVVVFYPSI